MWEDVEMHSARRLATALIALVALTACGSSDSAPQEEATSPTSALGPEMTSESSCEDEYPLVLDPATLSVVATAEITNSGDKAGNARVLAQWFPIGSDPIKAEETVSVAPGETVRVPFRVKPSQSAMNGMVGLQHGDEMCRVVVELLP